MSDFEPEEPAARSLPPRGGRATARGTAARVGVLLAAAATMGLVIVHARLVSAILGAELVLWVPGLGLLGAGAGGALAGASRARFASTRLFGAAALFAGLGSFFTIAATIAIVKLAPPVDGGLAAPERLCAVAALVALPFTSLGAALATVHASARGSATRVAVFDLVGAAIGIPVAVALLRSVGAPRAALALAVVAALAGVCFALIPPSARAQAERRVAPPSRLALVIGFLLGSISVLAGDVGAPWLRLTHTRGVRADREELTRWSELGLVTVDKPTRGTAWIHLDGVGTTGALEAGAEPPKHPDQLGWAMPGAGATLIVGAGGGRDIRAALAAGAGEIFATEVDPVIVDDVMRGFLREQSGDPYGQPGVHTVISDGRGYAARNAGSFHTIVSSLTDTGEAGAAATLVRSESGLYTIEGVATLLAALAPGGSLVVNRWDDEIQRLLVVADAALRARGAAEPRRHLFACSHQRSTALLVARDPLEDAAVVALRSFCKKGKFKEVVAPDRTTRPELAALLDDPGAAIAAAETDISAPTDDRPFYFHQLRTRRLLELARRPRELAAEPWVGPQAMLALLGVAALVLVWLSARLFGADRRFGPRAPRGLGFFAASGAAFALAETALVQRLAIFVAHPSHALVVVLLALVVSGVAGAVSARNVDAASIVGVVARRAQLLAVVVAALGAGLGPLLAACASLSTPGRALVAAACTVPIGALAGALAPLSMRRSPAGRPCAPPWRRASAARRPSSRWASGHCSH